MAKTAKSTKKFIKSGQLKKTIESRKKHQQTRKKIESRRGTSNKHRKGGNAQHASRDGGDAEDGAEEAPSKSSQAKGKGKASNKMSVDELLSADFMDNSDSDGDDAEAVDGIDRGEDDEGEDDFDDAASFASVDALDNEGQAHLEELSKLAEKDPEFFKFLQENDRELLDFNLDQNDDDDDEEMEDSGAAEAEELPELTTDIIRKWQKAILEQRSLRALRKLLIAFRSAVFMNSETPGQSLAWRIDNASVYSKLITTALKYTPVVLSHHVPYKTQANGKVKPPTQNKKFATLQKLILSFFHNTIHLLSQLTDPETMQMALNESAKVVPYIMSSRKTVKTYLKSCLELWSSNPHDSVRIAAFLGLRRLASMTNDEASLDNVLKSTYLSLVRSSKSTSPHTLPFINLMKNSASELFCLDQKVSYQHAFGYIRQLAIHLRNSMKIKSKDAYKQVYNWQYVHSLDFWSLVIARACDAKTEAETGKESPLKALIYPLVQVSLGAIKLISNSRSHPFHMHVIRSLNHLSRHTDTYIPIAPYILPVISSPIASSSKPKSSTLRPLDFDTSIRVPAQYPKTRVLTEGVVEEAAYLLTEWLASRTVSGSVAFPELTIPILVALRKTLKSPGAKNHGKEIGLLKTLVERIEDSKKWGEQRRRKTALSLAPGKIDDVRQWQVEAKEAVADSPLAKYLKVQVKVREQRKSLIEKARVGEDEFLASGDENEDDSEGEEDVDSD